MGCQTESKNDPITRSVFVTLNGNGLRKKQNLIESRPPGAETRLAWRENRVRFQKKSKPGAIMRSKNFETQKVREIDRKEARESRGFSIFWMEIIEDVFQIEEM